MQWALDPYHMRQCEVSRVRRRPLPIIGDWDLWLVKRATAWASPVLVESGAVEGVTKSGLTIYLGMPFAAPPLMDAFPHTTDAQTRQARLELERDLRFGWDMWAWERAISPSCGTCSIIWIRMPGADPQEIGNWPGKWLTTGRISRSTAIQTAQARRIGRPSTAAWSCA